MHRIARPQLLAEHILNAKIMCRRRCDFCDTFSPAVVYPACSVSILTCLQSSCLPACCLPSSCLPVPAPASVPPCSSGRMPSLLFLVRSVQLHPHHKSLHLRGKPSDGLQYPSLFENAISCCMPLTRRPPRRATRRARESRSGASTRGRLCSRSAGTAVRVGNHGAPQRA